MNRVLCFFVISLWLSTATVPARAAFPIRHIVSVENTIDAAANSETNTVSVKTDKVQQHLQPGRFYHYRQDKPKYRNVAILYCMVCMGLHRLYMGYTGIGIAQLIALPIAVAALLTWAYFSGPFYLLGYGLYYCAAMLVWQVWDFIRLKRGALQPRHGFFTNDRSLWRRHKHGVKNRF